MKILIIGGNRFFGLHLAKGLVAEGHQLTLLNRGHINDGLGNHIERLKADRGSEASLKAVVHEKKWDVVFDQVCYAASEAKLACDVFEGRTRRYVVTSSESVYDDGAHQSEGAFDPRSYQFTEEVSPTENYQEAKRQVETVFSKSMFAEVAIVRPSLVVGEDDYTGRLKWHLDRIQNGQPIYFPNLDVQSDFIRSDQAGYVLKTIGLSKHIGPVNGTSPGVISLRDLVSMCERVAGKKALLAAKEEPGSHSPYGGTQTKTMDTSLLSSLGVKLEPSQEWLETLMRRMVRKGA